MHLDLNLLTALDALLEEGSVSAAADRLGLSAPATSRALGRIRRVTGDEILVRTGRTMTATPRALALRDEVHALVQQAQTVLAPARELDLPSLQRTFTLRCHDALTIAIGPALLTAVQAQAPGVRLRLLAEASTDGHDLRHVDVDLEIGAGTPALADIRHETVARGRVVAAMRPEHPCAGADLTAERYAEARHVSISRRGHLRDRIDDALAALGLSRRVVATVPTSSAALHIARHSDVLVAVPEHMCAATLGALGLITTAIPLDLTDVPIVAAWHQRFDNDQAHAWLREQVRSSLRASLPPARSSSS